MAARRTLKQTLSDWFTKDLRRGYHYDYESNKVYGIGIRLLRGRYKNVLFTWENMTVDDTTSAINFNTRILEGKDFTSEKKFSRIAEEILVNTLEESMNNYSGIRTEILNDQEDRVDYFEEPVEERVVRKKSSSTSSKRVSTGKTGEDSL